eukprot:m.69859 g.69859  ORF g.69859 m.69859 type:complete len:256 (+) comp24149_c1_seq1:422-1189(+)
MAEELPYESRKWMCRDLSSVNEEVDEDGPWYDAIIVKFLSAKSSPKSNRLTSLRKKDQVVQVHTHFVGYPKDEDQAMDFTDENCVEHNDPRYSWSYDSKGAWLRKPSGKPHSKFTSIPLSTTGNASRPSSSKTTSAKKQSSSSTNKAKKSSKSSKSKPIKKESSASSAIPSVRTQPNTKRGSSSRKSSRQWSNLVNPVQLQGTRRIGVWNPQEISVQAIQLHYNRTNGAMTSTHESQGENWNGSWGFRSAHVKSH